MALPIELLPTSLSLAAVFAWGTSDFLGGYSARRANAFVLTTIAHASGLLLMVTIAATIRSPFPAGASVMWALAGGLSGGGALALFYRALSQGRMGLTAPVAAVLGAAIPTVFGIFTEVLPAQFMWLDLCSPDLEYGSSPALRTTAEQKVLASQLSPELALLVSICA